LVFGVCLFGFTFGLAPRADAQTAVSATAPGRSVQEDDAAPRVMEPDFSLINLPTTLVLPRFRANFHLTHRFLGNLREGSFGDHLGNLFGIDNGAIIGLEFRFAPMRHLQAIVYRNSLDKTIQISGQYDWLRQGDAIPFSVSGIVSIEGTNNFEGTPAVSHDEHDHGPGETHRSPAVGAIVSWTAAERLALYAVPVWVGHTTATDDSHRDTTFIGLGGRLRFTRRAYLVGEVAPRVGGFEPGDPEYGFGIEYRVGGHLFSLTFTNSFSTTFGQIARGGFPNALYLGFNLSRKFY
jgi:hypothetical protein